MYSIGKAEVQGGSPFCKHEYEGIEDYLGGALIEKAEAERRYGCDSKADHHSLFRSHSLTQPALEDESSCWEARNHRVEIDIAWHILDQEVENEEGEAWSHPDQDHHTYIEEGIAILDQSRVNPFLNRLLTLV